MTSEQEETKPGTEFYICVNCGHNGKFPYRRLIKLHCEQCEYDAITPYELEEIMEEEHLQARFKDVIK